MVKTVKWGGMVTAKKAGLSSAALRYLAIFLMLLDHTWIALIRPAAFWMTCVGRLSFPIFAFLIAEGFYHTSDRKKYALRLFVSGLISEIPYNLFTMANFVNPQNQNIMFTLLFGLLALWVCHWAQKKSDAKSYVIACAAFAALYVLSERLCVSYRGLGMTTVVLFGLLRNIKYEKLWQVLCFGVVFASMSGRMMPVGAGEFSIQVLAIFALPIIWLYNGKPGLKNKFLQYGAYLFYPAHLGVLVVLRRIL